MPATANVLEIGDGEVSVVEEIQHDDSIFDQEPPDLEDELYHELEHEEFDAALLAYDNVIEATMFILSVLDPLLSAMIGFSDKQNDDMLRAIALTSRAAEMRNVQMRGAKDA